MSLITVDGAQSYFGAGAPVYRRGATFRARDSGESCLFVPRLRRDARYVAEEGHERLQCTDGIDCHATASHAAPLQDRYVSYKRAGIQTPLHTTAARHPDADDGVECTVSSETELAANQRLVDILECSTLAPSEETNESTSEGEAGLEELSLERQFQSEPHHCRLIVFDWDDTLFPSSFIASLASGHIKSFAPKLRRLALLVEAVLRAARQVGQVAIVTLAKRPWITHSASKCLLGLDFEALVQELGIKIYYAREQSGLHGNVAETQSDYVLLKRNAMAQALSEASENESPSAAQASQVLDVLSIGDSRIEREALQELLGAWAHSGVLAFPPLCKVLKLMDKPVLSQLILELTEVLRCVQGMAVGSEDFDLAVRGTDDLADIVQRFV